MLLLWADISKQNILICIVCKPPVWQEGHKLILLINGLSIVMELCEHMFPQERDEESPGESLNSLESV